MAKKVKRNYFNKWYWIISVVILLVMIWGSNVCADGIEVNTEEMIELCGEDFTNNFDKENPNYNGCEQGRSAINIIGLGCSPMWDVIFVFLLVFNILYFIYWKLNHKG